MYSRGEIRFGSKKSWPLFSRPTATTLLCIPYSCKKIVNLRKTKTLRNKSLDFRFYFIYYYKLLFGRISE